MYNTRKGFHPLVVDDSWIELCRVKNPKKCECELLIEGGKNVCETLRRILEKFGPGSPGLMRPNDT